MNIQIHCPKDSQIERFPLKMEFPPNKDDILLIDGVRFRVAEREWNTEHNLNDLTLSLEPIS